MPIFAPMLKCLLFISLLCFRCALFAQITTEVCSDSLVPSAVVGNHLKGAGIDIRQVKFKGNFLSLGTYHDAMRSTGFDSGVVLCTGLADQIAGPNGRPNAGANLEGHFFRDKDLHSEEPMCDGVALMIDFIPQYDSISLTYTYGSEEYPEFVGKMYTDRFAFYLSPSGSTRKPVNLAILDNDSAVSINQINAGRHADLFVANDNHLCPHYPYLEYDGISTPLHAGKRVVPGQLYRLKIIIADIGDCEYDSAVFLEKHAFVSLPASQRKKGRTNALKP